jgi:hypothetical protein
MQDEAMRGHLPVLMLSSRSMCLFSLERQFQSKGSLVESEIRGDVTKVTCKLTNDHLIVAFPIQQDLFAFQIAQFLLKVSFPFSPLVITQALYLSLKCFYLFLQTWLKKDADEYRIVSETNDAQISLLLEEQTVPKSKDS